MSLRVQRAAGVIAACLLAACSATEAPLPEPVLVTSLQFMDQPRADIRVVMDALLASVNSAAAADARARGDTNSVGFVGVDSTGAVIAGTGTSLRTPQVMVVYSDSAWARLVARSTWSHADSALATPDFAREVVLVSWFPPVTISNAVAYQTISRPRVRGDAVEVSLGAALMPPASSYPQTSLWQASVWRVQRGGANALRVVIEDGGTPVTVALPKA